MNTNQKKVRNKLADFAVYDLETEKTNRAKPNCTRNIV